jgi:hypothetical protein
MNNSLKTVKSILRRIKRLVIQHPHVTLPTPSYSQSGEDMIVRFFLNQIKKPSKLLWLDIGAHHPTHLSNTAIFYNEGKRGINIEPNPFLIRAFIKHRVRDINLNVAIADKSGTMDFYIMDDISLSRGY